MPAIDTELARRAPGRPRSARADEAIIRSALDLLAEGMPVEAISIESIAARAGVGKATIYRRWSSKEALIVDAIAALKGETPEVAGESVKEDLLTLMRPSATAASARLRQVMPCLLAGLRRSPELYRCYQQIMEPRRNRIREVLRRGVANGELRADLDVEATQLMLVGPMLTNFLVDDEVRIKPSELAERLVETIWPSIRS